MAANYYIDLAGIGSGNTLAAPGDVALGDNRFLWQKPSSIEAQTPAGWWTTPPVQKAAIGLGTVAVIGVLYYLFKTGRLARNPFAAEVPGPFGGGFVEPDGTYVPSKLASELVMLEAQLDSAIDAYNQGRATIGKVNALQKKVGAVKKKMASAARSYRAAKGRYVWSVHPQKARVKKR